jgi:predicted TIM-barrel fold metal-dependent hydrolase
MPNTRWHRREILGAAAATAAVASHTAQAQQVPFSSGDERAALQAPPNAADCHHHVYDHRFPVDPKAVLRPPDATVADYRLLMKRLGITRHVVVQPSTYGVDNRCLLDAMQQFGLETARAVAVVNTQVTDDELHRLQAAGVRGIRFNLAQAGATTVEMIEPLSKRVHDLGWHVQFNMPADRLVQIEDVLNRVPTEMVFDHLAHVPEPAGTNHPSFAIVSRLLHAGRAWVKLSGAYADSKIGPPTYADRTIIAQAYVSEAPERLVWGTDWPHPTEKIKPDDALLFDLLSVWAPDDATRTKILVENPAKLYGFG